MMVSFRTRATLLGALLLPATIAIAEDDNNACGYSADDVAPRVKDLLGPSYAAGEDDAGVLAARAGELEALLVTIGHCRAVAQSIESPGGNRQRDIIEWHSLNQWLYRLSNFLGQNLNGDTSVDWRAEYALFAEVYEFEP